MWSHPQNCTEKRLQQPSAEKAALLSAAGGAAWQMSLPAHAMALAEEAAPAVAAAREVTMGVQG